MNGTFSAGPIFVYADAAAYRSHLQTEPFQKYKVGTKDLQLIDTQPLNQFIQLKSVSNHRPQQTRSPDAP